MPEHTGNVTVTQLPDPFLDEDLTEDLLDEGDDGLDLDLALEPADFADEDAIDDDFIDEDDDDLHLAPGGGLPVAIAATSDPQTAERLDRLEAAARQLAEGAATRESRKVKRKVAAATTGAGAAGCIPILLQLVDAYNLDPAVGMAISAVASLIGAFAAGWITPERRPTTPPDLLLP